MVASMVFYPDAIRWGDVATWVSAVGAVAVGVGLIWIALRTNSLAAAANDTHRDLMKIEARREDDRALEQANRRTLALISISTSIAHAEVQAAACFKLLSAPQTVSSFWTETEAPRAALYSVVELRRCFPADLSAVAREVSLREGARMMRAATIPDSVLKILKNVPNLPEDTKLATYQSALTLIAIAKSDLQIIAAACKGAAKECGMVDIPTKKMLDALSEKKPPH